MEGVGDEVVFDLVCVGCSLLVWMMEVEFFLRFLGVVVIVEGLKMEFVGENFKWLMFYMFWLEDDCIVNIVFDGVIELVMGWGDEVIMIFCIIDWGWVIMVVIELDIDEFFILN